MKKRKLLIPLLMAIVMMAMSPTRMRAASDNEIISTEVSYNQTGSKVVITLNEYKNGKHWVLAPELFINLNSKFYYFFKLDALWSDFKAVSWDDHNKQIDNSSFSEKSIVINNVNVGTARFQNHHAITGGYAIELHLTFNQNFSFYGYEIGFANGEWGTSLSSYTGWNRRTEIWGYPRPKSLTATQNGSNVDLSWQAEIYNSSKTSTDGSWYIYRGTTQLGSVTYGTTSHTDTNAPCGADNYTVVFVPSTLTASNSIPGLSKQQSITIPHTYGDPLWEWTGYESATCTRTCTNTNCTESTTGHTASVDVTLGNGITYAITTPATCTEAGKGKYTATATVAGTEYSDYKEEDIPALGHTTPDNFDDNGLKKCTACSTILEYQSLVDPDVDWYSINNAGQLISFAKKVNRGDNAINGRLTKDIDMQGVDYVQIGNTEGNAFRGTLDGQFYTIKNLNINTNEECGAALIKYTKYATIQKLTVQGTFTTSNKYAGGFIGQNKSDGDDKHYTKIDKCISAVNIESSLKGDGTHGGFVGVAEIPVTLSDCAFIGSIKTTNGTDNCAGLVGWSSKGDKSTATNCFVTATFDSGVCQKQMMRNCSDDHFPTCYYVNTYCNNTKHQGTQITSDQLTNGYLCYMLNGGIDGKTDGTQTWYQKISTDNSPVLKVATDNTVYCSYGEKCTDLTFSNTPSTSTPNHDWSASWKWAEDGKSAKATLTCQNNATHKLELDATISSEKKDDPTCTAMGTTTYTAKVTVAQTDYTDAKDVVDIAALAHTYPTEYTGEINTCSVCGNKQLTAAKVSVCQNATTIETAQIGQNNTVFQFNGKKLTMSVGDNEATALDLKDGAEMSIEYVTYNADANKATVPVSDAGYATVSSAFPVAVPANEGIAVYAPTYSNSNIVINGETKLSANTVIPAATGLLIKGSAGSYEFAYNFTDTPSEVSSALTASVVARPTTDYEGQIYALGMNPGIGFYRYSNTTTDACKAFLLLPAGSSARIGFITDDDVSAISQPAIISLPTGRAGESLYNLAGQRVSHNTRGIIIVNGKKYINK